MTIELRCPRCRHPITEEEDAAETVALGKLICLACGFVMSTGREFPGV